MKIFISSIVLVLLLGCSSKPDVIPQTVQHEQSGMNEIYVVSHGWHTGFVIPSEVIYSALPELENRFQTVPYIEFGWGDKGFYQAKEITSGLTLRAIFWPTQSVVHAVAVPVDVYEYFPNSDMEKVMLSSSELASLVKFISNSFYRDETGEVRPLKNGIYGNSQFYQGVGDYYLMNTCNKWTAKGLKSAGMELSTTFKLTASSVMDYLKRMPVEAQP